LPSIAWLGQHALTRIVIANIWQWTPFVFIMALRVSRTATEFRELGVAAAMSKLSSDPAPVSNVGHVCRSADTESPRRTASGQYRGRQLMPQNHDKQRPAFYVLTVVLVFMSVEPVLSMFVNSSKLDVDIASGAIGP